MSESTVLVGDIGGTNVRFAIAARPGRHEYEQVLLCDDFVSAESAIQHYLEEITARWSDPLAWPSPGLWLREASLTNNRWLLDEASLRAAPAARESSFLMILKQRLWEWRSLALPI